MDPSRENTLFHVRLLDVNYFLDGNPRENHIDSSWLLFFIPCIIGIPFL